MHVCVMSVNPVARVHMRMNLKSWGMGGGKRRADQEEEGCKEERNLHLRPIIITLVAVGEALGGMPYFTDLGSVQGFGPLSCPLHSAAPLLAHPTPG